MTMTDQTTETTGADAHHAAVMARHDDDMMARHNRTLATPRRRRRQDYSAWGIRGVASLPAYAVRDVAAETRVEAVCRSIEAHTRLCVVTCRHDGTALPERAEHYQITLGRSLRSGGYSVEGSLWISIPAD